jgi:hypothetical protein
MQLRYQPCGRMQQRYQRLTLPNRCPTEAALAARAAEMLGFVAKKPLDTSPGMANGPGTFGENGPAPRGRGPKFRSAPRKPTHVFRSGSGGVTGRVSGASNLSGVKGQGVGRMFSASLLRDALSLPHLGGWFSWSHKMLGRRLEFRRCEASGCEREFAVDPVSRRTARKYCSNACEQRARRRRQAARLLAERRELQRLRAELGAGSSP